MLAVFSSALRLIIGLVVIGVLVTGGVLIMLCMLPWRHRRIRFANHLGTAVGSSIMKISGCPLIIEGREHFQDGGRFIFAGNHTSVYDAFTSVWLSPTGTVGVAKKEIIYYPFYGLAYLLAGHLTLDRGDPERAKRSMIAMGEVVRRHALSVLMWPEGTRSRDGRLLPFKKGVVHLALQTGLPIIPMVTIGAHHAWNRSTLLLKKAPITIRFLPPVDTSGWSHDRLDEHVAELHRVFADALPPDQQPLELMANTVAAA